MTTTTPGTPAANTPRLLQHPPTQAQISTPPRRDRPLCCVANQATGPGLLLSSVAKPEAGARLALIGKGETPGAAWEQQSPGARRLNVSCPTMREPTRSSAWWCASTPPSESRWPQGVAAAGCWVGRASGRPHASMTSDSAASRGHNDSPSTVALARFTAVIVPSGSPQPRRSPHSAARACPQR